MAMNKCLKCKMSSPTGIVRDIGDRVLYDVFYCDKYSKEVLIEIPNVFTLIQTPAENPSQWPRLESVWIQIKRWFIK